MIWRERTVCSMGAMKRFTSPDGKAEIIATLGILKGASKLFVDGELVSSMSELLGITPWKQRISHGEYNAAVTFERGEELICDWRKYPGKQ